MVSAFLCRCTGLPHGVETDFSRSIHRLFKRGQEDGNHEKTHLRKNCSRKPDAWSRRCWVGGHSSSRLLRANKRQQIHRPGYYRVRHDRTKPSICVCGCRGPYFKPRFRSDGVDGPFSSLKQVPNAGVDEGNVPFSVAVTGLDASHVVTANFDLDSTLHIDTWTIGSTGVVKESGASTSPNVTNNPAIVEITAVSSTEIVVAFQDPNSALEVQAWTIAADGVPTMVHQYGSGITLGGSFSITTLNPNEVLTAAVDGNSNLWVSTWGVDTAGISSAPQSQLMSTGSVVDTFGFSSGPVSIAAGSALQSVSIDGGLFHLLEPVSSAFTPIIASANIEVVKWGISGADILTQTNIPSLSTSTIYIPHVGACMLPQGVRITAYGDQNGFAYAGVYGAGTSYNYNTDPDDPHYINNAIEAIAAIPAGADNSYRDLFQPWNAYFVLGVLDNNDNPASSGRTNLQITVLSYPMRPELFIP
jgi:hypothetical protein